MASALSFLVNANPSQDVRLLNQYIDWHIFDQYLTKNAQLLTQNSTEIVIDSRYNLRPDLLSYETYGTNFWYPAILVVNKIGSILQFKAEYLNNKCLIPSAEIIHKLISESVTEERKKRIFARENEEYLKMKNEGR